MRRYIHAGLVSALALAAAGTAQAAQIDESEINHPIGFAQRVDAASGGMTIAGVLGNLTGTESDDTDYFVFHGMEGDVVTLDIDGGWGGARSVDTVIAIFGGSSNEMLRMNDDASSLDDGSTSRADSRLDNFRLPASGYYVVGVSNYPRYFMNGGAVTNPSRYKNGDYKLVISGVTPQVQQINIEIKPGNDGLAPINPRSNGKIPVALLSSTGFDAMNVDPQSLSFGATGAEASLSHCGRNGEDVNGDGRLDLVCHFENQKAGFAKGDLEGILQGRMKYGTRFEGRGLLKVVPEKRDF
jgi:Bacterial pre-peptidase C-terminal domain.